jgi:hypothetical protein
MMWITSKLDQIVGFSGNILDIRKRDMLPSPAAGKKEGPPLCRNIPGDLTNRAASQTKGIK